MSQTRSMVYFGVQQDLGLKLAPMDKILALEETLMCLCSVKIDSFLQTTRGKLTAIVMVVTGLKESRPI